MYIPYVCQSAAALRFKSVATARWEVGVVRKRFPIDATRMTAAAIMHTQLGDVLVNTWDSSRRFARRGGRARADGCG